MRKTRNILLFLRRRQTAPAHAKPNAWPNQSWLVAAGEFGANASRMRNEVNLAATVLAKGETFFLFIAFPYWQRGFINHI